MCIIRKSELNLKRSIGMRREEKSSILKLRQRGEKIEQTEETVNKSLQLVKSEDFSFQTNKFIADCIITKNYFRIIPLYLRKWYKCGRCIQKVWGNKKSARDAEASSVTALGMDMAQLFWDSSLLSKFKTSCLFLF